MTAGSPHGLHFTRSRLRPAADDRPDLDVVVVREGGIVYVSLNYRLGAFGPVVFGGNLDPSRADDRFRRWVTSSSVAADYRDRDEIDSWARGIAARLAPIL